ncbi:MAG: hypothetical protein COB36_02500 [Alphaproteobacteria bacterium]|nr:MAG: hypothetical protein COB36_02500 [Alphaproteobacteria bacterium]
MMLQMKRILSEWMKEKEGVAAIEAAMIFPIMLMMFLGVFDAGNAILANQKTVRASQVVADLITRKSVVSATDVTEAISAGRLALEPLDSSSFGIDIVSIRFDEDANSSIEWRETVNMGSLPDALGAVEALEDEDEGVVMVSVKYVYTPLFSSFISGPLTMNEVAFSRGRRTPVITHE